MGITGSARNAGASGELFRLDAVIVLLAIDLTAGAVLFVVDLGALLTGQFAAVGLAIGADLLVDALLAILGASGFAGGHLSTANTLGDAVLLIFATLADLVVAVVGRVGIVLVVVDRAAEVVLLTIDLIAFLLGELTTVGGAIVMNFTIEIGFAAFEIFGFTGGELAGLHAVGDAILLVFAAVVDSVAGLRLRLALCEDRA